MTSVPSGPVTVLFTDLEASTKLMQRLGDVAAHPLFGNHITVLSRLVEANRGEVANTEGDGLMAVFPSPVAALTCAQAVQQAVYHENQQADEESQLRVRVGLDVGELQRSDQGYFGTPVVRARRLCDRAQGGEIWASQLVRGLVEPLQRFGFRDLGSLELKGIAEPVPSCEVVWEPAAEAQVDTSRADEGQAVRFPLPPQFSAGRERTAFVGREKELGELRECWESARAGQRRFVLLAGEGGIGKTRLAAELAIEAHTAGATVLYGRADEEGFVPYQPFVEALRHYVASSALSQLRAHVASCGPVLTRLVPELAQRLPGTTDGWQGDLESERYRLFEAILALLTAASRSAPIVLVGLPRFPGHLNYTEMLTCWSRRAATGSCV